MKSTLLALLATLLLFLQTACSQTPTPANIPHLQLSTQPPQLLVHNKPFLALGGELGNSTASDPHTLELALAKCQRMHLNTVMLPVYWDLLEPEEGHFDFSLLTAALDSARHHHLHLVYLWFGTWKNSMSCYAPSWVKRDTIRFPRAQQSNGQSMEIISPESTEANQADARAFAALMHWTRQHDAQTQTVIMIQVENEIGMIPEPRDHSPLSEAAYHRPVPAPLLSLAQHNQLNPPLNTLWQNPPANINPTWPEAFGTSPQADELFSAWQFATYLQKVAAAGKAEYPLPMYANAALIRPQLKNIPGQYPSAGPLPHLLQIYRTAAPALDMISPDIYFPNFMEWCTRYTQNEGKNPLFIPEMAPSARAPANALYAIAHFNALGTGPFSIENVSPDREQQITACYSTLASLSDLLLTARQTERIIGLSPQIHFDWSIDPQSQQAQLANILFHATFDTPPTPTADPHTTTLPTLGSGKWDAPPGTPLGAVLILQLTNDEFLIAGSAATITFSPANNQGHIGIDSAQEGHYEKSGTWIPARRLNGDETHQGRHIHLDPTTWSIQRVKLYRYD